MDIITRAEIGYRPPKSTSPHRKIEGIIVHWVGAAGMAQNPSVDAVKRTLRGIQAGEMDRKKEPLPDVSYSFFVDPAGNAYEGRGDAVRQAASNNFNDRTLSICYVGGPGVPFTAAASASLAALCRQLGTKFPACAFVRPHSEIRPKPTACPGDEIRAFLKTISFNSTEDDMTPKEAESVVLEVVRAEGISGNVAQALAEAKAARTELGQLSAKIDRIAAKLQA